jgi:hypothetical protein
MFFWKIWYYRFYLVFLLLIILFGLLRILQFFMISKALLVVFTLLLSIIACFVYLRRLVAVLCSIPTIAFLIILTIANLIISFTIAIPLLFLRTLF